MIQVQIAATLEADGVSGSRWVLVDPSDSAGNDKVQAVASPAAPVSEPGGAPQGATVKRTPLTLHVLSAVVLLAALAGAWWLASMVVESRPSDKPVGVAAPAAARAA